MDYEKNVEELNDIMNKLDNEKLSIEDSIKLFERAESLYKNCYSYLETAKGSIYKIREEIDKYREEKIG